MGTVIGTMVAWYILSGNALRDMYKASKKLDEWVKK